jgi:hypothetical protein
MPGGVLSMESENPQVRWTPATPPQVSCRARLDCRETIGTYLRACLKVAVNGSALGYFGSQGSRHPKATQHFPPLAV